MFSGGIGTIDDRFVEKKSPEIGMSVAKIGGPVYRSGDVYLYRRVNVIRNVIVLRDSFHSTIYYIQL